MVHGMSASYECLQGFQVEDGSNSFEIPCANGIFSTHHGCSPVSCGAPPAIVNAVAAAATATVSFPDRVEYDCRPGFSVDGAIPSSFEISCQADGTFTQGICEPVKCPNVPTLANAEWTQAAQTLISSNADIESFTVLQYRCMEGFSFAGLPQNISRNVECLANGQFSALRSCVPINDCSGHTCGPFGMCLDQHMNYTCECLEGYEIQLVEGLEGAQEIVCGDVDDCNGVQCGEGGTCEDQVDGYACNCRPGFRQVELDDSRTCERVQCGSPPTFENAVVDGGGKAVFEDVTTYECLAGFSLNSQHDGVRDFTITCQDNGNFSSASACIPIECGVPPQVEHATVIDAPVSYPDAAEYQCDAGYTTTGSVGGTATFQKFCTESGRMLTLSLGQAVTMSCLPVSCGTPPSFDLATVGNSAVHTLGEVAEYTCNEGFTTDPVNPSASTFTSECLADGSWADAPGACSPVSCALPDDAELLATFAGLPVVAGQAVTVADFTMPVVYQCQDGYTVDGNPLSIHEQIGVCSAEGVLTVSACVPVTCAYGDIEHGPQATIVGAERDFTFGESANLRCNAGWEIATQGGPAASSTSEFEVTCLATGQFSSSLYCQNIDDCVGHTCGAHGVCIDGLEDYSCDCQDGFAESVVAGEKVCGDVDDCNGVSCGAAGTCVDEVGSFTCECGLGHNNQDGNPSNPCVHNTCELPMHQNTQMEVALTLRFEEVVQIHCSEGYTTNVGVHFAVRCSADGSIVPDEGDEIPMCVPKSCGPAPALTYAAETPDYTHDFTFGESAHYVCQGGVPEIEFQCGPNGWILPSGEGTHQSCQNSCGQPVRPLNGRRNGQGAVFHPQSAEFSCDEGYTHLASGAASAESARLTQSCGADGQFAAWSAEISTSSTGRLECIPVQCQRPDPPAFWRWTSTGAFDSRTPAELECEGGYSSNGMPHSRTMWSVTCNGDGSQSQLPAQCEPITHRIQGEVSDAVDGELLPHATVVVTDRTGAEHTVRTNSEGVWSIDDLIIGNITIHVSLDAYADWEHTMNFQHDVIHGPADTALNPHLDLNSWRVVLTWAIHPRDLDGHVTRHAAGPEAPTLIDPDCGVCGHSTERTHLYWRQTWLRSMTTNRFWIQTEDLTKPAARLDRDNQLGNGIPETITYFRMNTCEFDCLFVYRVWDYCSLPDALVAESEALVRLYNSDGLHSTYRINANGLVYSDDGYITEQGFLSLGRRWDVFQLDATGGDVRVEDCTSGNCPADQTFAPNNHHLCFGPNPV